jgi:hypothetical protein
VKALAALLLIVSAGDYDRTDVPISMPCTAAQLGAEPDPLARLSILLVEQGPKEPVPVLAQWDPDGPKAESGRLVAVLPGTLPKGATRTYRVLLKQSHPGGNPLGVEVKDDQYAQISHGGKPVLRYNHGVVTRFPDKADKMDRGCYAHPLWTPSGRVVTQDFPADHLHHRGLWFAWVVANQGATKANFWEFWQGKGKVVNKGIEPVLGRAFAGVVVHNACVSGGKTLLDETMTFRHYVRPADVWIVDLEVRQEAVGGDVTLGKKHYGGLGHRGLDAWNGKDAPIDVLTSEGDTGRSGNFKPARWFDFTGRTPDGGWAGLLVIEHPDNPRYPSRLRIHPKMPFVSTTLCQTGPYTIKQGEPLVLRYRLAMHDGKADKALAERLAADLIHPPKVTLKRGN